MAYLEEGEIQPLERRVHSAVQSCHQSLETSIYFTAAAEAEEGFMQGFSIPDVINRTREKVTSLVNGYRYFSKGVMVEANASNLDVLLEQRSTLDIVQTAELQNRYVEGQRIEELDTSLGGRLGLTKLSPYITVVGSVNYSASCNGNELESSILLDRKIRSSQALISELFSSFQGETIGQGSELARIVNYILTTIAQFRVLQGAGIGSTDISEIVAVKDVEMAVNLGLLLEQARHFRTIDPSCIEAFHQRNHALFQQQRECINNSHTMISALDRTIANLTYNYGMYSTIDPADIFALFTCLDVQPIDMQVIVQQPIFVLLDQLVLKYLDYLSIGDPDQEDGTSKARGFTGKILDWLGIERSTRVDSGTFQCTQDVARVITSDLIREEQELSQWMDQEIQGWLSPTYGAYTTYKSMGQITTLEMDARTTNGHTTNFTLEVLPGGTRGMDGNITWDKLQIFNNDGNPLEDITLGVGRALYLHCRKLNSSTGLTSFQTPEWHLQKGTTTSTLTPEVNGTWCFRSGHRAGTAVLNAVHENLTTRVNITVQSPKMDDVCVSASSTSQPQIAFQVEQGGSKKIYARAWNESIGAYATTVAYWSAGQHWQTNPEGYWVGNSYERCFTGPFASTMYHDLDLSCLYPTAIPSEPILGGMESCRVFYANTSYQPWLEFELKGQWYGASLSATCNGKRIWTSGSEECQDWTPVRIPINDLGGKASIGFQFSAEEGSSDPGPYIRSPVLVKEYNGTWVEEAEVGKDVQVRDYHKSWQSSLFKSLYNGGFYTEVFTFMKDALENLFMKLSSYLSKHIIEMLDQGQSQPYLRVDPRDRTSILEETSARVGLWLDHAYHEYSRNVSNQTYISDLIDDLFHSFVCSTFDALSGIADNTWGRISSWLESAKDSLVSTLKNAVSSITSQIQGFLSKACSFLGMGKQYDNVEEGIRDFIEEQGTGLWEEIETEVRSRVSEVRTAIGNLVQWAQNSAWDMFEPMLDRMNSYFQSMLLHALRFINSYVKACLDDVLLADSMNTLEYQLPLEYLDRKGIQRPFQMWRWPDLERAPDEEIMFLFEQETPYLNTTNRTWLISEYRHRGYCSLSEAQEVLEEHTMEYLSPGDLLVELGNPKGVHFTDFAHAARMSYQALIPLDIMGKSNVSIQEDLQDGFGSGIWSNKTLELNISLNLVIVSAWALEGVEYRASNTLLDDFLAALHSIWDKLMELGRWIIRGIKKLVDMLVDLAKRVIREGMELAKSLVDVVNSTINGLRDLLQNKALNYGADIVTGVFGRDVIGPFTVFGFNLTIEPGTEDCTWFWLSYDGDSSEFQISANLSSSNLVIDCNGEVGDLGFDLVFDLCGEPMFSGLALYNNSGHGWNLSMEGGVSTSESVCLGCSIKSFIPAGIIIPTPIPGVLVILDMGASFSMADPRGIVNEEMQNAISSIFSTAQDSLLSGKGLSDFISQAKGIIFGMIENIIQRLDDSAVAELFLDMELSGGTLAGMAITISFLVKKAISTLAKIFHWIYENIKLMLENIWNKLKSIVTGAPDMPMQSFTQAPEGLPQLLFLQITVHGGAGLGGVEGDSGFFIAASLSALAALVKKDWGPWEVEFGVFVSRSKPLYGKFVTKSNTTTFFSASIKEWNS